MRPLLLLALLVAGPGWADCPTRAALQDSGTAYVRYPDASLVEMRWLGAGMVEETTRHPDSDGDFRMISMGGVFITDEVDLMGDREIDSTRITSIYPPDLFGKMPVKPNQTLTVAGRNEFADGTAPEDEDIRLQSGDLAEVDIAGCRYQGFPMVITYRWGDEYFTSMMTHVPELGLSLEIARMDQQAPAVPYAPRYFGMTPP
ncbi:hypothetical protein [Tropicimonas sp. IMCC34043]|uniref:hypothetical protein n=1 Tax=Tropicimonas sp. IMCC34043 TaxID=2248760 RepID=UPI000E26D1DD|nr:hypothetical protein [Tropicimonas sp. IMCC34043]